MHLFVSGIIKRQSILDLSEINPNKVNYHVIKLIYENINLMDENIKLILENKNLRKRVERAMEFDSLVIKVSGVRDVAYWKQRNMELEEMLKKVLPFCPSGYNGEVWKVLSGRNSR